MRRNPHLIRAVAVAALKSHPSVREEDPRGTALVTIRELGLVTLSGSATAYSRQFDRASKRKG